MIANISRSVRIVSVSMLIVLLQSPLIPIRSFRLLGHVSVARCAIARSQVPSAAGAEVPLGKMHPKDATSFGPKLHRSYAPPPPGCTRSSDIFPVYALSQAINTAASCLVNVLLPKF